MTTTTRFSIPARRAEVSAFADRFEDYCLAAQVPTAVMHAFQVVFDELLTNTIDYAYGGEDPDRSIELRFSHDADAAEAELIDDGIGFDPLQQAPAPELDLELDDRPIGGLGIHLVKSLMDEVEYRRLNHHNHLRLRKRYAS